MTQKREVFNIPEVSAEAIMEAVEGICLAGSKGFTLNQLSAYLDKTKTYSQRCINVALQLKMIKDIDGKYIAEEESKDILRMGKEQWPILFRKLLQRYEPFTLFISLMNKGNSIEEACRKVKVIYGISSSVKIIRKSLIAWGKYASILKSDGKGNIKLTLSTEKSALKVTQKLVESLNSDIKLRLYLENKLTDEVFGYLHHDEIEFLINGLKNHHKNPRGAIEDSGKAFEDFLRRVGADNKVDLSKCNGIGQCAQTLRKENIITQKHLKMCEFINAFRLMAAHSKEKLTLTPWKINSDTALEIVLSTLTAIRSIFIYTFNKQQIV